MWDLVYRRGSWRTRFGVACADGNCWVVVPRKHRQVGEPVKATAICDGRGNAGTGARAAVLYIGEGIQRDRHERAEKIPATTNIVAEHLAIQLAMELAKEHGVTELVIYNDSRTPVNHVNGNYKVKQAHLVPIVDKTW